MFDFLDVTGVQSAQSTDLTTPAGVLAATGSPALYDRMFAGVFAPNEVIVPAVVVMPPLRQTVTAAAIKLASKHALPEEMVQELMALVPVEAIAAMVDDLMATHAAKLKAFQPLVNHLTGLAVAAIMTDGGSHQSAEAVDISTASAVDLNRAPVSEMTGEQVLAAAMQLSKEEIANNKAVFERAIKVKVVPTVEVVEATSTVTETTIAAVVVNEAAPVDHDLEPETGDNVVHRRALRSKTKAKSTQPA
jgi:hypothetical protein